MASAEADAGLSGQERSTPAGERHSTVWLRVLGPISGAAPKPDGNIRLDLGGPRQRRLLAALAVDASRLVPGDRLAERVWGEHLPEDPRASLRTLVARLRQALGTDAIVREGAGYRLDAAAEGASGAVTLDSLTFVDLVAGADEPGMGLLGRLDRLEAALALWNGPAFDEVAHEEWARGEAERLDELRATSTEHRFEAMLATGKHRDALPQLAGAVESFPLRDRLVGLQMLALFRAGRQAEAARVFQAHRARLAVDLGLEPGRELAELDRRIVAGDASLHLSSEAMATTGRALRGYRLGEQLGEGSLAVVFRGTQPSVGRDVAVKVIRAELANRPDFVRRFEAEAQIVASLEHPHIVPLYDYWREPDRAYLVLRYLRGGTLQANLADGRGLPLDQVRTLVLQVGSALAAAHRVGVVHRDVRPANVFLDDGGNHYLGDFGIALAAGGIADPETVLPAIYAPAYAAPEQLCREPVGPLADLYGLGITVYEAMTGRRPFPDAVSHADLVQRQLHQPMPAVRLRRREVPAAVDDVLARATAKSPPDRFEGVEDFITAFVAALDDGAARGPGAPAVRSTVTAELEARNPYKGLRPFSEADAADFRGRARLVDRLVATLSSAEPSGRVAVAVGPSGIGKSSAIHAGLLPALRRGAVPGSERWFVATMVPGRDPYAEMATALLRLATKAPGDLIAQLVADRAGLARVIDAVLPDAGGAVLLVIDQFEELFTLCEDDAARRRFLEAVQHAVTDVRCPLRVLATIRADFYDRPLRYGSFARLIEPSTVAVTALAPDELEAAIVEPAAAVGCEFEPGLVSEIVSDVGDQPGSLPLLQYVLTELYEHRSSERLTRQAYRELGGVAGALAGRAEELTSSASVEERAALRRLFGRLVVLGEGAEDTRRRVPISELRDDPATGAVIDRFGGARLLSFDRDPASREPTVEMAHEALIRQWPRLRGWLEADRDGLRVHRHLTEAARSWAGAGRDDGELYRGARLELALDWFRDHPTDPNAVEREFLEASRAAAEATRRREARARRRLRRTVVAVAVVAVVALVSGALAFQQRSSARDAADAARDAAFTAESGRLAALGPTLAETDLSLSMLLGVEAVRRAQTAESLGALQRTFVAAGTSLGFLYSDEPLRAVFVDGDRIVGFGESTIVRWDAVTHQRLDVIALGVPVRDRGPLVSHPVSYVKGIAAWVGRDDVARSVDLSAPAAVREVAADAASVVIDPTTTRLAIASKDGGVVMVDRTSLQPVWRLPADGIATLGQAGLTLDFTPFPTVPEFPVDTWPSEVAFSPDGTTLLHARAGWLNWLDAATGARRDRSESLYVAGPGNVTNAYKAFAFDGSGGRMFVSAIIGITSYDTASRSLRTRIAPPHRQPCCNTALRPLPDGSLAVLATDGDLSIVDPDTGTVVSAAVDARVGRGAGLELTPDGTSLLVAGDRGVALVAIDGGGLLRRALPSTPDRPVLGVTKDATWVIADVNGVAAENHRPPRLWRCHPGAPCSAVEGTPWADNTFLSLAGGWSNTWVRATIGPPQYVQVIDVGTGQPLSPLIEPDHPVGGNVAIPADRSWMALNRTDQKGAGSVQVHALPSGQRVASIAAPPGVLALAMPPSEAVILVYDPQRGESLLIDPATWTARASPLSSGEVTAADYSQDGRWLVTADSAGDLVLRDPNTFAEIRRMSSEGGSSRGGFAFSDDGRYLVSTQDGKGRLWDVESGQLIGQPIEGAPAVTPASFPGQPAGFVTATGTHIQIWRFDPPSWVEVACRAAGRNLTRAEWLQYGPRDTPYRATCGRWPTDG